jgi:hypothetical protein
MPESEFDQIVDEYLGRLRLALAELSPDRRQQLIVSITDHISEARSTLHADSEVAIRDILDRVGQPEEIAAEAMNNETKPPVLQSSRTRRLVAIGVAAVIVFGIAFGTLLASRPNNALPTNANNASTTTTTIKRIVVPNILGEKLNAVEVELTQLGFAFSFVYLCPHGQKPPLVVASQSPRAGESAAFHSRIRITIVRKNCR